MAIVFLATFLLWCVLVLAGARFRETWRASAVLAGRAKGEGLGGSAADGTLIGAEKALARGRTDVSGGGEDATQATQRHPVYSPEADPFEALSVSADERTPVTTRSAR